MAKAAAWLVVMAKEPAMGGVKSRLARDIGWVRATAFYRRTLALVLKRLSADPRWVTVLAVTPDGSLGRGLWPGGTVRWPQGPGDLGARMGRLMASMPPGPVVIIGSDVPDVAPAHIAAAFALLGANDAVLGPATDGGYWLVGERRSPRVIQPFAGVRWSGPHAMADTLANLGRVRVGLVDELSDVDDGKSHHLLAGRTARLVL